MDHRMLLAQARALTEGVPHVIANLANISAALWQEMEDINWAGFYIMEGGRLVLGPFQGKPAGIEIPVGRGVCGRAVAEKRTQLVYDVHQFEGHIACDSASNSELVVPIFKAGQVWGVLDIDSPTVGRFTARDQAALEELAALIGGFV